MFVLSSLLLLLIPATTALDAPHVAPPPIQVCSHSITDDTDVVSDSNCYTFDSPGVTDGDMDMEDLYPELSRHLLETSSGDYKKDLLDHLKALAWQSYYESALGKQNHRRQVEAEGEEWSAEHEADHQATRDLALDCETGGGCSFAQLNMLLKRVAIGPIIVKPFLAVDLSEITQVDNACCCNPDEVDETKDDHCSADKFQGFMGGVNEACCDTVKAMGSSQKTLLTAVDLGTLWVGIDNIILRNIRIGNIVFTHRKVLDKDGVAGRRIEVDIELSAVGLAAELDWAFWLCKCTPTDPSWAEDLGGTYDSDCKKPEVCGDPKVFAPDGDDVEQMNINVRSGGAKGSTSDSWLYATIAFEPEAGKKFDRAPPEDATYPECRLKDISKAGQDPEDPDKCMYVNFEDMDFVPNEEPKVTERLLITVATMAEKIIITILEGVVEDTVLKDLVIKDLLTGLFNDLLADLKTSFFNNWIFQAETSENPDTPPIDTTIPETAMLAEIAANGGYSSAEAPKHLVTLFDMQAAEGEEDNKYWSYVRQAIDSLINVKKNEDGTLPDPADVTYEDIKLNGIINGISEPKDSGRVKIADVNIMVMNGSDIFTRNQLTIESVYLGGLNTFKRANLLEAVSSHTIENVLILDKISVEFDMRVKMWPAAVTDSRIAQSSNELVEESFRVSGLQLENITVDMKLLTAVDKYIAANLMVGALYNDPMNCAPTMFRGVNMSFLEVTAQTILPPFLDVNADEGAFIDEGTTVIVNSIVDFAFETFGGMVTWLLPSMSQTTLKDFLSDLLADKMNGNGCTVPVSEGKIDFQTEPLIKTGLELIEDNLTGDYKKINSLVRDQVDGGNMTLMDDFKMTAVVPLGPGNELGIEVELKNVKLSGLDTFRPSTDVLRVASAFVLENTFALAKSDRFPEFRKLRVELDFHIGLMNNPNFRWNVATGAKSNSCGEGQSTFEQTIDGQLHYVNWDLCCYEPTYAGGASVLAPPTITNMVGDVPVTSKNPKCSQTVRNTVHVSLNLMEMKVVLDLLLRASKQKVKSLKLRELQTFKCWYSTLDISRLEDFDVVFGDPVAPNGEFNIGFDCIHCDGASLGLTVDAMLGAQSDCGCDSQGFLDAQAQSKLPLVQNAMTSNFNRLFKKFTQTMMGTESAVTLARKATEAIDVCRCSTNPDTLTTGPAGVAGNGIDANMLPGGKQWASVSECDAGTRINPNYDNQIGLEVPEGVIIGAKVIAGYIMFKVLWRFITLFLDMARGGSRRQIFADKRENKKKKKEEYNLFKKDRCLGMHPAVAMWMRFLVPFLLWLCIGLFAASHTSVLASIDIKLTIGGDILDFKEFQIMKLQESLVQMWEAKVYSLFFILFGFSFLWPYVKLFSLLFTWYLPPLILTSAARGGAISVLDLLGKWSLIDIYVFTLTMSAFLMHIYSPPAMEKLLGLSFYQVDLQVTPLFGLLASMIAGVVMPATNELMILAHRDAVADTLDKAYAKQLKAAASLDGIGEGMQAPPTEAEGLQSIEEEEERMSEVIGGSNPMAAAKSHAPVKRRSTWIGAGTDDVQGFRKGLVDTQYALCRHVWENEGGRDRIAMKRPGMIFVAVLVLIPLYFCWLGGTTTSWSFDRNGLVGILIDMGDDGMDLTDYSVLNVGQILVERQISTNFLELFTVYFFLVCCAGFAFIFPLIQQIVMAYVWLKPMTLKELKIWYFVIEVLSGWATMDVFMVSIIVCLMQIGMLSEFMIPPICQFLDGLVPYGFVDEKDMMCFYIEAYLGYGCLTLAIAVLTTTATLQLIQGAAMSAIEDRENRIKGVSMKSEINLGSSKKFKDAVWYVMSKMFICDLSIKEEFVVQRDTEASEGRESNGLSALLASIGLGGGKKGGNDKKKKGRGKSRSKSGGERSKSRAKTEASGDSFDDDDDFDSDSSDDSSFQPAPPSATAPPIQAPPGAAAGGGLPPGWTEQASENGTYFWNFQTGVTSWVRPTWPVDDDSDDDSEFVAPPPPPGDDDIQMSDMNGRASMT